MPKIFKLNFSSPANLPIVPITPPPVPIPELWGGLQVWLDPSYGVTSGQFAANAPDFPNQFYFSVADAANRLRWKQTGGAERSDALYLAPFSIDGWQELLPPSDGAAVNGKNSLRAGSVGQIITFPFPGTEAVSKYSTPEYTYMLAYKAGSLFTGGIFGAGGAADLQAMDNAGLRFGFESGENTGKTLYQHSPTDRLLINRNTADTAATLAVITCNASGQGVVTLKASGTTTQHPFSFSAAAAPSYTSLGLLDPASATVGAAYSAFARWNRRLSDAEVAGLVGHMSTYYGPF